VVKMDNVSMDDAKFLIEQYILDRIGKEVNINPEPMSMRQALNHQYLWHSAYMTAFEWFAGKVNEWNYE